MPSNNPYFPDNLSPTLLLGWPLVCDGWLLLRPRHSRGRAASVLDQNRLRGSLSSCTSVAGKPDASVQTSLLGAVRLA
jgi:hypothetical protein